MEDVQGPNIPLVNNNDDAEANDDEEGADQDQAAVVVGGAGAQVAPFVAHPQSQPPQGAVAPIYPAVPNTPTWTDWDGWHQYFNAEQAARANWVLINGQPCVLEVVLWPPLNPNGPADRGSWVIQCHRLSGWVDFCANPEEEPWLPHCSLIRPCDMNGADVVDLQHITTTLDGMVHTLQIWPVNDRCTMFPNWWDPLGRSAGQRSSVSGIVVVTPEQLLSLHKRRYERQGTRCVGGPS